MFYFFALYVSWLRDPDLYRTAYPTDPGLEEFFVPLVTGISLIVMIVAAFFSNRVTALAAAATSLGLLAFSWFFYLDGLSFPSGITSGETDPSMLSFLVVLLALTLVPLVLGNFLLNRAAWPRRTATTTHSKETP